jgi:monovalent cation:proton antiporter-2 (CPA2) family protein
LGYLIAGIVIGPFGLELLGDGQQGVMEFAEFGVVLMLFLIGLELEPQRVWRMRSAILGLGGLQVTVTTVLIAAIALAVGLSWQVAIAVGMTLALSSTAIVMQTLSEKGLTNTAGGQSAFSVLLFQDLAVIPMLAIIPLLGSGAADHAAVEGAAEHGPLWIENLAGRARTLMVLGAVAAVVLAGRFVVRPAFRFIARTHQREIFTAGALLLVIGIALLMDQVGLSPALGTFVAGVVLANSEYRHELEVEIEPIKGLLLGVFFIAVGASIDFALVAQRPWLILALVAGLITLKALVLFGLGRVFGLALDQNLLFALALAEAGEFAFVLFSFARQNDVLSQAVIDLLVAVVALTMAPPPLLLLFNQRVLQPRIGTRQREQREADVIEEEDPVIIAGFGNFGSAVGRLLSANGVGTTVLDNNSDRVGGSGQRQVADSGIRRPREDGRVGAHREETLPATRNSGSRRRPVRGLRADRRWTRARVPRHTRQLTAPRSRRLEHARCTGLSRASFRPNLQTSRRRVGTPPRRDATRSQDLHQHGSTTD